MFEKVFVLLLFGVCAAEPQNCKLFFPFSFSCVFLTVCLGVKQLAINNSLCKWQFYTGLVSYVCLPVLCVSELFAYFFDTKHYIENYFIFMYLLQFVFGFLLTVKSSLHSVWILVLFTFSVHEFVQSCNIL